MRKSFIFLLFGAIVFFASAQNKIDPKNISLNCFIANNGQWPAEVAFLARTHGMNAWILKNGGVVYDFFRITDSSLNKDPFHSSFQTFPDSVNKKRIKGHVIRMDFANGNLSSGISKEGKNKQSYYYNFIIGSDTTKWASFVSAYGEVIMANIYKGIDIRYYYEKGMLRYDFIVHPGTDPAKIKMQFNGQEKLLISENGELEFATNLGLVTHQKLSARQKNKTNVSCSFRLFAENEVGFDIQGYNGDKELIIDPLVYSTYLGGNSADIINAIEVDGNDCAFVTGATLSNNFPYTTGAYDTLMNGLYDAFVTKFNNTCSKLIYSTFIGGTTDGSECNSIYLDSNSGIFISGRTESIDFPVTPGAFDVSHNGDWDIFVCKLNTTGSTLLLSTYLGGTEGEQSGNIIIDNQRNVYISGSSYSVNYPTTSGCFDSVNNRMSDIVLTKLNSKFDFLIYSTYIGDTAYESIGKNMLLDKSGEIILTGSTASINFPVTSGSYSPYTGTSDAFLLKMNKTGSALIFSTCLGKAGYEAGYTIYKSGNDIILAGITNSPNFPVQAGCYDTGYNGDYDIFVVKFDSKASTLKSSTYLGGSNWDYPMKLFSDSSGNFMLTGFTKSNNFPVTSGTYDASFNGLEDVIFFILNSDLTVLNYSTFIGGNDIDRSTDMCIDKSGFIYICGYTNSNNFPFTHYVFDTSFNITARDGFLLKFSPCPIRIDTVTGGGSYCMGNPGMSITLSGSQIGVKYTLFRNGVSIGSTVWGSGSQFTFGNMTMPGVYTVMAYDSAAKCSQLMAGSAIIKTIPEMYNVTGGGYHCMGDSGLTIGLDSSEVGVEYELIQDSIPTGKKITGTGKALTWSNNPKGNYEIHAFAKFGCNGRMSGSALISDFIKPAANFIVNDSIQCQGKNLFVFTNKSKISAGALMYRWNFGDGNMAFATDTVHTYTFYDTFRVTLFAISDHNCIDSVVKNMVVYVSPKTFYTVSDTISCTTGTYFNFYDNSSISYGSYTRLWSFGDNVTSKQQNPTHGYGTYDSFKAKLTLTSSFGCKDSFSRYIYVVPVPRASYTLIDSVQCLGSNTFEFINTSKTSFGPLSYVWKFGDGNFSSGKHPLHSYLSAGTYKISLLATAGSSCLDSFSGNVYVSPGPIAAFSVNDTTQCLASNAFTFTDFSKIVGGNITSISWNLGDGTIVTSSSNPTHSFKTDDSFNVQLNVNADIGCNDSTIIKVYVRPMPKAGFTMNLNPQYLATNNFIFSNTAIVKYGKLTSFWDFGDGNTSNFSNPVHSYAVADSFVVRLVATSEYGCPDTFIDKAYITSSSLNASFKAGIACAGDSMYFTNKTSVILPDSIRFSMWEFGDFTGTVISNDVAHLYTLPGTYRVILNVITKNGIQDWDTQMLNVMSKPTVFITFVPDTVAVIGEKITLSATGTYDSVLWNTGSTASIVTIDKTGTYWVSASFNTGCNNFDTIKVRFVEKTVMKLVNAITPNGDGKNDCFKILNLDLFAPCKVKIYNRWGDELFSTSNYQNEWDARYKGKPLAEGAYYYIIQDKNGLVYKGAINVLR